MDAHERVFKLVHDREGRQFTVMGATTVYKAIAEDTGGAYSLAVETTPPRGGLSVHIHQREDEAMYILEGEYEIQCGDRTVRASKGAFVFLPRGVPNRFQNVTNAPASFLYITSPGGFEKFMEQMELATAGGAPNPERVQAALRENEIEMS
jgi:mannose-6-phosphate isomerase-like protein (cupin superfamily)